MSVKDDHRLMTMTDAELAALFPGNFLWGAATAAYQIEGATNEDGRSPSTWDYFATLPGAVYQGETGEIAADHYHRMPEDVALMKKLGLKSYRFSISWSRVLPSGTGTVNRQGLDFYERLVDELLNEDIVPLLTLYHWDLPMALHERGGWIKRETALAFADYTEVIATCLGDRVKHWITLNEPWCNAFLGYGTGFHAPGLRDMNLATIAGHHLLLAHGLALPRLRALTHPQAQIGITLNLSPVYPLDERPSTHRGVEIKDAILNRWFLEPIFKGHYPGALFSYLNVSSPPVKDGDLALISAPIDFLGINYYSRTLISGSDQPSSTEPYAEVTSVPGSAYTAMGWEVYTAGLTDLLVQLTRDYAPHAFLITENGAAFTDTWDGGDEVHDPLRVSYLREHIAALGSALLQGVPVRGYYAWSLLDNYEWTEGYSKRFGIVYVDYSSQRRIIKQSGLWYGDFLRLLPYEMKPL